MALPPVPSPAAERPHHLRVLAHMRARYGERFLEAETYIYTIPSVGYLSWDITRAKERLTLGQVDGWGEVPPEELNRMATTWAIDEEKVAAADPSQPGIAAPMLLAGERQYILIDGVHRATRAYRDKMPFVVAVLSAAANRECLLEAPPGLVP